MYHKNRVEAQSVRKRNQKKKKVWQKVRTSNKSCIETENNWIWHKGKINIGIGTYEGKTDFKKERKSNQPDR